MAVRHRILAILFAVGVGLASPMVSHFAYGSSARPDSIKKHAAHPPRGRTRSSGNRTPQFAAAQVGAIAPPSWPRSRPVHPLHFVGGMLCAGLARRIRQLCPSPAGYTFAVNAGIVLDRDGREFRVFATNARARPAR